MSDPKKLTRSELAEFLPNHRAVKAFEKLFDLIPSDLITLQRLMQEASINAESSRVLASSALELLNKKVLPSLEDLLLKGENSELKSFILSRINPDIQGLLQEPIKIKEHNTSTGIQGGSLAEAFHFTEQEWKSTRGIDSVLTITSNHNADADEEETFLVDTSLGDITIFLPSSVGIPGKKFIIKKIATDNIVIISPDGSENIDGLTSLSIAIKNDCFVLKSDSLNWMIE